MACRLIILTKNFRTKPEKRQVFLFVFGKISEKVF